MSYRTLWPTRRKQQQQRDVSRDVSFSTLRSARRKRQWQRDVSRDVSSRTLRPARRKRQRQRRGARRPAGGVVRRQDHVQGVYPPATVPAMRPRDGFGR